MIWIAPTEKDQDHAALEKRLWDAADQFRANSGLKSQEYSAPVLGITGRFDLVLATPPFNATGRAGLLQGNCSERPPSFSHS